MLQSARDRLPAGFQDGPIADLRTRDSKWHGELVGMHEAYAAAVPRRLGTGIFDGWKGFLRTVDPDDDRPIETLAFRVHRPVLALWSRIRSEYRT